MAKFPNYEDQGNDSSNDAPDQGSDAMDLTLGGSKSGSGAGFGPGGKAHQSRAAGNDSDFVISPEPEDTSGEPLDGVYEAPFARGVGMPWNQMHVKPEDNS